MTKYAVALNDDGQKRFLEWVENHCGGRAKCEDGGLVSPDAWLEEFEMKLAADSSRRDYEMGRFESASGKPELFMFDDDDLNFE